MDHVQNGVATVAQPAAANGLASARLRPDRRGLLHDQERLLRQRPRLDRERVRGGRRHGARPVRHDRVGQHIEHILKLSARLLLPLVRRPLRLWWRQHWLVHLDQEVHLQVHPALAAAFFGAVLRLVGRGDGALTKTASPLCSSTKGSPHR
eukprot:scaffold96547_cov77-Phaeocystis_antarctica.AAC.1